MRKVSAYIQSKWDSAVQRTEKDDPPRLYLPFPYTTPCGEDHFQDLYYWDTYFACVGLLIDGRRDLAAYDIRNFIYEIETYGFIPNSNAAYHLNRSQPPYFVHLLRDYLTSSGDKDLVRLGVTAAITEYDFWMTERVCDSGLNRHYHSASENELDSFYNKVLRSRLGFVPLSPEERIEIGRHYTAEAETGRDFTPRFQGKCADFSPVELNANLYYYETTIPELGRETGVPIDDAVWKNRAEKRLGLMNNLLWDEERGAYLDYGEKTGTRTPVLSTAAFSPLAAGAAEPEQAERVRLTLPLLEREWGIASTEPVSRWNGPKFIGENPVPDFQWMHPNGWPPEQCIVIQGLLNYGYRADAKRIASKYLKTVNKLFEETGSLWEKINVETGRIGTGEYKAARMQGWSAGVYQFCAKVLADSKTI